MRRRRERGGGGCLYVRGENISSALCTARVGWIRPFAPPTPTHGADAGGAKNKVH